MLSRFRKVAVLSKSYVCTNFLQYSLNGTVYKAINKNTSKIVTLNEIEIVNKDFERTLKNEAHLLGSCNNAFIVGIKDFYTKDNKCYVLFSFPFK